MIYSTVLANPPLYEKALTWQRFGHAFRNHTLRQFKADEPGAREFYKTMVNANAASRGLIPPPQFEETEFEPEPLQQFELDRFNPSRAILGLEKRGLVVREHYRRQDNLALTREGFAEARRLGGVRDSEIVDLDRMQEGWREPRHFYLAMGGGWIDWRADARGIDTVRKFIPAS